MAAGVGSAGDETAVVEGFVQIFFLQFEGEFKVNEWLSILTEFFIDLSLLDHLSANFYKLKKIINSFILLIRLISRINLNYLRLLNHRPAYKNLLQFYPNFITLSLQLYNIINPVAEIA